MKAMQTVDVGQVIDTQRVSRFNVSIAIWMFLILLADGYDSAVAGFAAPLLANEWGIRDLMSFGPVFSASVAGIVVGAPLFGYFGDRFGRKRALITGSLIFSTATLATVWADDIAQLIALRFVAGMGIGGAMPLAFVMTGEFAPKRVRATLIAIGGMGVGLGGAAAGLTSALLASSYGWQLLFLVGGVVPMIIVCFVAWFVPESPKYLALRSERRAELVKVLQAMKPELQIDADTRILMTEDKRKSHVALKDLFEGPLARLTPMIWAVFIMVGMTLYFIQSWTPTLFTEAGLPNALAAIATSSFQLGAILAAPVIGPLVDRHGTRAVMTFLIMGIPLVAGIGLASASEPLLLATLFGVGFMLIGANIGMIATSNIVYPVHIRADGVGWAMGLQKLGSIAGAMLGGYLVAIEMSVQMVFLIIAVPVVVASLVSWRLRRQRFPKGIPDFGTV